MHYILILAALLTSCPSMEAGQHVLPYAQANSALKYNPYIPKEARNQAAPYLLPENHPIASNLDYIFSRTRASENNQTLLDAGFTILFNQPRSRVRVVAHDLLPGYLLKIVTDSEKHLKFGIQHWEWFVGRCQQQRTIARVIKKYGIKHFVVANKWLYALPANPPSRFNDRRKDLILVAERMDITSEAETLHAWKTQITPEHLDELFIIMNIAKGTTYRPDNIPVMRNGQFAIVDTEFKKNKASNFNTIRSYLSDEMAAYWDTLTTNRGFSVGL